MRKEIWMTYVAGAVVVTSLGCAAGNAHTNHAAMGAAQSRPMAGVAQSGMQSTVDRDTARFRAATVAFKSLDAAVAAGYPRASGPCIKHPTQGAMGYHHDHKGLMDDRLEVERPEILVYERMPSGEYVLNGVEYMVPFSARPGTAEPPTIMGQKLKPFEPGKFWYLHAWVWTDNPSGLFADWNPNVRCGTAAGG